MKKESRKDFEQETQVTEEVTSAIRWRMGWGDREPGTSQEASVTLLIRTLRLRQKGGGERR